ncbi:uncharacterized protein LOC117177182 [Belonocnema kinseyi]|uniref:uncharacterized protein LOC117177182 n=1 Tax=Belonocnema kinseyi TaxID=2817044 RepID=UPI00143DCC8D|nr:uncharacterized protein LOC117177182 [Belonocnema kinseyi]
MVETYYLVNGIPYLGKTGHPKTESSGEFFFRKVTETIHGTDRSVTCDNWFTSVPLLKTMYVPPYNMKITGTIRKNKPDIPNQMKIGSREVPASSFCHSGDVTLVSYKPNKNKIILLVSTKMTKFNIGEARKPEMVLFYNKTKGGTDTFDKLCHAYTTARATNRWPMRFFFGMHGLLRQTRDSDEKEERDLAFEKIVCESVDEILVSNDIEDDIDDCYETSENSASEEELTDDEDDIDDCYETSENSASEEELTDDEGIAADLDFELRKMK